jgi:hypothetical protein
VTVTPEAVEKMSELAEEVERLRNLYDQADLARAQLELRVTRLRKAVKDLIRDAQAAVDQDNPFLGKQLNNLAWNSIPAARQALEEDDDE